MNELPAARSNPLALWTMFAVIGAIFFVVTAGTFSSFGIVLPYMINELSWSWATAGSGFSVLALSVGLASTAPAWLIRRVGVTTTYLIGGVLTVSGFLILATVHTLLLYFPATAMLGIGYTLCSTVPAIHLLSGWMPQIRSLVIGMYMTMGALGAVAGPLIASRIVAAAGSWRIHWWAMAAGMLVLTCCAVVTIRAPRPAHPVDGISAATDRGSRPAGEWRFAQAIRTSQFWLLAGGMTAVLLCTLTMNTFAFSHLGALGVGASTAAAVMSGDGAVNSLSRAMGGILGSRVNTKHLMVAALLSEAVGMGALSTANNWGAIGIFVLASGFGFGMCCFASTILLLDYFGTRENPEIFGTFNLITTVAMIGPIVGGFIKDQLGGFAVLFQGLGLLLLAIAAATLAMRPPRVRMAA